MSRWICPLCEREFDRERQAHFCAPGITVDEWFAERPPQQRAIYDAIVGHLAALGDLHIDAVGVGVFLKAQRKIAEIRPRAKGLALLLLLPRRLGSDRVTRGERLSAQRQLNVIVLTQPSDVDDELLEWLTEAYVSAS